MRSAIYILLLGLFTLLGSVDAYAQRYKERGFIRSGNELYERGNYVESEVCYRRAIEKAPESIEANYNVAASLYKQEQFKEAAEMYETMTSNSVLAPDVSSKVLYNRGNALFKQRELEEALESYKSSLRINPNDMEAKFNLAYTKILLDKEKEDQKSDDQKDKDQDQKDDQDKKDDHKDKGDQDNDGDQKDKDAKAGDQDKKDDKKDDKKEDKKESEDQEGKEQQNQGKISKQDAEQMLNAVQMEEDKTREKQDAKKVKTVSKSGKNW